MAVNPMQRKARNSFLLGMLLMLLIAGVIVAFLVIQLMNYNKKEQEERLAKTKVYVLNQDVLSGQVLTTDMFSTLDVNKNLVPNNATGNLDVIKNYSLKDKEGNEVITESKNNKAVMYLKKDVDNKDKQELLLDEKTGNYYYMRNNDKQFVELISVPLIAKVPMKKNTVITTDLISKSEVTDDLRKEEYNMFVLPMDLETGDYIDVRLLLPSGQDFIVVAKKEVTIPQIAGVDAEDTIDINLREDEILSLSSAIVDAYRLDGSKLYVTKYAEAGIQNPATPTYIANAETVALIDKNPNIIQKAKDELISRYRTVGTDMRNQYINAQINKAENADNNLKTKMEESITNSKTTRKEYLNSLNNSSN